MASYTSNLNLKKPAGSENVAIGDINNNMDIIDTAYGTLNSKVTSNYGEIETGVQYEICGNIVTIFINGKTVSAASSWTTLVNLPSGADIRYSAHYKAMSGHDIQITGSKINYRGSAGDVYGACTYVKG